MKKKTKKHKLYIYELNSGDNYGSGGFKYETSKVGIISESDEMTLDVLEKKYKWGTYWGDVDEFEQRDADGGHKKLTLLKVIDAEPEWVSELGVGEVEEINPVFLRPILFDAKEFVKQLSGLKNSQLDELIEKIEGLKK